MSGPLEIGRVGMVGMVRAVERFDRAAARVAHAPDQDAGGVEAMVDEGVAKVEVEANLATIKTADELTGTLLHVIA